MTRIKRLLALNLALLFLLPLLPVTALAGGLAPKVFIPEETGFYRIRVSSDNGGTPGYLWIYPESEDESWTVEHEDARSDEERFLIAGRKYDLKNDSDNTVATVYWDIEMTAPAVFLEKEETAVSSGQCICFTPKATGSYAIQKKGWSLIRLYDTAGNPVKWQPESSAFPSGSYVLEAGKIYYSEKQSYSITAILTSDQPLQETPADGPVAYPSTQYVEVDGRKVEFQMYALKDANGYDTNYVKVRDVAYVLSGTAAQFQVGWDGAVNLEPGKAYQSNGSEMKTPFSGPRPYTAATAETRVNGQAAALEAILLNDDAGGGYTYYKLRDLGAALGFNVDWSKERGIYVETDKLYGGAG